MPSQTEHPILVAFALDLEPRFGREAEEVESEARVAIVATKVSRNNEFKSFRAHVRPRRKTFDVSVHQDQGLLQIRCGCSSRRGCVHVLLAVLAVLGWKVSQVRARRAAAQKGAGAANRPFREEASPQGPVGELARKVEEKLGRPLVALEQAYLESLDSLYRRDKNARQLSAGAINVFLRDKHLPQWDLVVLWPKRPESSWEALVYLVMFARNRGARLPEFAEEVVSPAEVLMVSGDWGKKEALRAWEERLAPMVSEMELFKKRVTLEARLHVAANWTRLECQRAGEADWFCPSENEFQEVVGHLETGRLETSLQTRIILQEFYELSGAHGAVSYARAETRLKLARLLLHPLLEERVVGGDGRPMERSPRFLAWRLTSAGERGGHLLELVFEDGSFAPEPIFTAGGSLNCYVAEGVIFRSAPLLKLDVSGGVHIPEGGLDSLHAVRFLHGLGVVLPEEVRGRILRVTPEVRLRGWLEERSGEERLCMQVFAKLGVFGERIFTPRGWEVFSAGESTAGRILDMDESGMDMAPGALLRIGLRDYRESGDHWTRLIGKRFPEEFSEWLDGLPQGFVLEFLGDLAGFKDAVIRGSVRLEAEETSPDWFDLRVALSLSDTELSKEEIQLLLEARGKFVRLKGKGWKRLEVDIGEEDAEQLSEMGLNPQDFNGPPQRYHALQLVSAAAQRLLDQKARDGVRRSAEELRLQVTPPVPAAVCAQMRVYQEEGFHFLTYLSSNRFGGILADDMGLGKTLQTLAWIAWLREQPDYGGKAVLVVCPKSVVQNWLSEAKRFVPGLKTLIWRGGSLAQLRKAMAGEDLVVVNYAQLRLSAEALTGVVWHGVVLDEAQYIKNPASQTALAAFALQGNYRLALSGTPIENRLMDLWSIMQFAMPGLLGLRAHFQKQYDARGDVLARRRLASRVRPFVLRRTKAEVAKDLPERMEEDLIVEMEGTQKQLYQAELKRARQALLKLKTSKELDKDRFNILASLLRLRQICCHPGLVSEEHGHADSAKMEALVDLLEPLFEQGHKVLVFSQFVSLLERVEREFEARGWPYFMLTGETENRGELVESFQKAEGAAGFLVSLRAGGMGLNLTAASYVILFDPWWNPAVENQAIDRTHRIGQTRKVIAYRLVAKDSVEEKIRQLQRSKSAMAGDILGEESFAKALSIEDFRFLMED